MRVPTDRSLTSWIRELEDNGEIWRFYKTPEWRRLRAEVLDDNHSECVECRRLGVYTRAVFVHHVNEVRDRPELALTRHVETRDGIVENLVPLCREHHEAAHGRACAGNTTRADRARMNQLNEERW